MKFYIEPGRSDFLIAAIIWSSKIYVKDEHDRVLQEQHIDFFFAPRRCVTHKCDRVLYDCKL